MLSHGLTVLLHHIYLFSTVSRQSVWRMLLILIVMKILMSSLQLMGDLSVSFVLSTHMFLFVN